MTRRLMRIVTIEREVWYEEGTNWTSLIHKDEKVLSASVEYDPTHPAFDAPLFGEREWCLHCGSDTCEHAAQHNAAYGDAS